MIRGLEYLCYEDRLRELRLFSVEQAPGRTYSNLPVPKGAYRKDREGLFTRDCSDGMERNGFKLKGKRFRLATRKKTSLLLRH